LDIHDDPRLPGNALRICQAVNAESQSVDVVPRDSHGVLFDLRCHLAVPSKSGQYDFIEIYTQSVRLIVGLTGCKVRGCRDAAAMLETLKSS
jgi:hypothetical protein